MRKSGGVLIGFHKRSVGKLWILARRRLRSHGDPFIQRDKQRPLHSLLIKRILELLAVSFRGRIASSMLHARHDINPGEWGIRQILLSSRIGGHE